MINSVTIQNFQSHKLTELEFDKGVNVIVGPSDSGKSAILRALNWLIQNKPNDAGIHSHWSDNTTVTLQSNDNKIIRHKSKTENQYQVNDLLLKAFRQKVPQEVNDALNISDLNIHHQLHGPFLFSKSSGEVARYLNKVINLDVIDSALANVGSAARAESSNLKSQQNNLEQYEKELDEYNWIEVYDKKLCILESIEKLLNEKENKLTDLQVLIMRITDNQILLHEVNKLLQLETKVNELLELERIINGLGDKLIDFNCVLRDLEKNEEKLESCKSSIEKSEVIYNKHMKDKCPLCGRNG